MHQLFWDFPVLVTMSQYFQFFPQLFIAICFQTPFYSSNADCINMARSLISQISFNKTGLEIYIPVEKCRGREHFFSWEQSDLTKPNRVCIPSHHITSTGRYHQQKNLSNIWGRENFKITRPKVKLAFWNLNKIVRSILKVKLGLFEKITMKTTNIYVDIYQAYLQNREFSKRCSFWLKHLISRFKIATVI